MRVLGTSVGQERVHIKMAAASAPELPQIPDTVVPTPQEPVVPNAPNPWPRPAVADEEAPVVVSYRRHENWPDLPENSYLFEFFGPGAWGQNSEVAKAALVSQGLCLPDDIKGGFYLERPGHHYVTFKSGVNMIDKLDGTEVFIRDRISARVSAVFAAEMRIKIFGIHPALSPQQFRNELRKFLPDWETCKIEKPRTLAMSEVTIKTKSKRHQIPHHVEATDPQGLKYTMRVVVPGRPTICPVCKIETHFASQCTSRKATRRDKVLETEAQGKKRMEDEQTTTKTTEDFDEDGLTAEERRIVNENAKRLKELRERSRERDLEEFNRKDAEDELLEAAQREARRQREKADRMKNENKEKDEKAKEKKKKDKEGKKKTKSKKGNNEKKDKKKLKERETDGTEDNETDISSIESSGEESEESDAELAGENQHTEPEEVDIDNDSFHTTDSDADEKNEGNEKKTNETEGEESGGEEKGGKSEGDITNIITDQSYRDITSDNIWSTLQGTERVTGAGAEGNVVGQHGLVTSTPASTPHKQKRKQENNSNEPEEKNMRMDEEGESRDSEDPLVIDENAVSDDSLQDTYGTEEGGEVDNHCGGV